MRRTAVIFVGSIILIAAGMTACSNEDSGTIELIRYPLDDTRGVISRSGVTFDEDVSSDGKGSLRIDAVEPVTVRLFETGDIDLEGARLVYRARLRTKDVKGQVYLEMWCSFPGRGEFFSRALHAPVSGNSEWLTQETFFLLRPGEDPDNVRLNIAVNGSGTVWIDDVTLEKGEL